VQSVTALLCCQTYNTKVTQIINTWFQFCFQTMQEMLRLDRDFTNDQCGKTTVQGTMNAGINNVIYMELLSGPKMANGTCRKTIVVGMIDRDSTVLPKHRYRENLF
jgi:hypothetical protein